MKDSEDEEKKSRSQMKREMLALQELGTGLLALSPEQRAQIDLPEELREALLLAEKITKRGAKRRQLQLIGKLMRDTDPESIREVLAGFDRERQRDILRIRQSEKWRDEIIMGKDSLLEEIMEKFVHADRQKLRQLARNARKEKEKETPPRSSRLLFRYLMELQKMLP